MAKPTTCPVSDEPALVDRQEDFREVFCPTCGQFRITEMAMWLFEMRDPSTALRATILGHAKKQAHHRPTGIPMITDDMVPAGPAPGEYLPAEIIRSLIRLSSIAGVELDLLPHHRGLLVRRMMNEGDVVFGVWQDTSEPIGFAVLCLKGDHLLPEIVANGQIHSHLIVAIPCEHREQAVGLLWVTTSC